MSNLFNHTVQPLGSTTSPVEDLALEVADAFEGLSASISTDNTTITNFKDVIGNPLFESLRQHKVEKEVTEFHTMLDNETDIVLENIPLTGSITVSYLDVASAATVQLTPIDSDIDFTDINQFIVLGKVVRLNIVVPKNSSITIQVTYSTETFSLNNKKVLSNVIKKLDDTFLIKPEQVNTTTYNLTYDFNLSNDLDKYIKNSDSLLFFSTEDDINFIPIEITSYSIKNNKIEIISDNFPISSNTSVLAFVNNISISQLLNDLYAEFIKHDHSNENITKNISHNDLINKFVNTDTIDYKNTSIPNYDHPQYLNREGYNSNLDGVYENAMLGSLFLSKVISSSVKNYKGLDTDSNAIMFGDPVLGHTIKYSRDNDALTLSSLANVNGLYINTLSDNKYGLKLNGSVFKSNPSANLNITPEGNVLDVSTPAGDVITSKFDIIKTKSFIGDNTKVTSLTINDVTFKEDPAGTGATVEGPGKLRFNTGAIFTNLDMDKIGIGGVTFEKDKVSGNVMVNDPDNNQTLVFNLPVELKNSNIASLSTDQLVPNLVKIGDINLAVNPDPVNHGMNVWSSVPTSNIEIKTKTILDDAYLKQAIADKLGFGDVTLKKTSDNNLEIASETSTAKVIVSAPIEFLNLTTGMTSAVNLQSILAKLIKIGKHSIMEEANGDVTIKVTDVANQDTSKIVIDSNLYANNFHPVNIKGEDATGIIGSLAVNNLKLGDIVVTNDPTKNTTTVSSTDPIKDVLIVNSKTKMDRVDIETLTSSGQIQATNIESDNLKIGNVLLTKDTDNNLVVGPLAPDKTANFNIDTNLNKAHINEANIVLAKSEMLESTTVKVGGIAMQKSAADGGMLIAQSDVGSTLSITAPTVAADLTVVKFTTTGETNLGDLKLNTLGIQDFTLSKIEGSNDVGLKSKDGNKFVFQSPMEASDLTVDNLNTVNFKLLNQNKILINDNNYIINNDGKFDIVGDKPTTFAGSSVNSGLRFTPVLNGSSVYKQYVSANAGTKAVDTEKNMFVELDTTDGMYFLRPTNKKISKNNVIFGFNDTTAQQNVGDLRKWFRADLFAGNIESTSITASVSESGSKNGIKIGDTRISVIGPDSDCPTGLTVFETLDSLHLVKPLNSNQEGCRDLTYQELNVGYVNTKGDMSVDGSLTVTQDMLINGSVGTQNLSVSGDSDFTNMSVSGNMTVAGKVNFASAINFKSDLALTSDLVSTAGVNVKEVVTTNGISVGKDLNVAGSATVEGGLELGGGLTLASGISSNGTIKSAAIDTVGIHTQDLTALGNASISGTTVLQGRVDIKSSSAVQGSFEVSNSLTVIESVVAANVYSLKDTIVRGKLSTENGAEFDGKTITIGSESSNVQLNGKLSFNTQAISFNSPISIYNTLKVTDGLEITGKFNNKGGIDAESYISAKGNITTEASIEAGANLKGKSGTIDQNLSIGNSLMSNNVTTESLAVSASATISNLTISSALSMPSDTSIVAGVVKASSFTQTNPDANNNFTGSLTVSRDLSVLKDVSINSNLNFNNLVTINSNGIAAPEGRMSIGTITANAIQGTERIQPPATLTASGAAGSSALSGLISQRDFVRIDHLVSEGITVFTQPMVADTIYYKNLIFTGDASNSSGAVNILVTAALYG